MAWIKVTRPDGSTAHINSDQLVRIRPSTGAVARGANAILDFAGGQFQATRETPDQVVLLISEKRSKVGGRTKRGKIEPK